MTEADLARMKAQASLDQGGSNPWTIITCGEGSYDLASKVPSSRRLQPGDFVWMDAGCSFGGYWSDKIEVSVFLAPKISPQQRTAIGHQLRGQRVETLRHTGGYGARDGEQASDRQGGQRLGYWHGSWLRSVSPSSGHENV